MQPRRRRGRATDGAFECLPVAATLTDGRGRIRAVNREARRLAGPWPRPDGGRTCRDYWGCRVAKKDCPLLKAVSSGRVIRHALVHADGPAGPVTLIERVSPMPSRRGERGAVLVTGPATAYFRRIRRLRREAHLDPLTSLLNRRRFDSLMRRALAGERRRDHGAFLMLDVDDLKRVNDERGHAAGDRLLRRLGLILGANTRRGDIVGRVGGDEFAAYCPDTRPAQARELVRRLQRAMAAENAANPSWPRLSAQFGVAFSRPGANNRLREEADARLRERKRRIHAGRLYVGPREARNRRNPPTDAKLRGAPRAKIRVGNPKDRP